MSDSTAKPTAEKKDFSHIDNVTCTCGHKIFDGEVIRSRCVKVHESMALCRCKKWVSVPVFYLPY